MNANDNKSVLQELGFVRVDGLNMIRSGQARTRVYNRSDENSHCQFGSAHGLIVFTEENGRVWLAHERGTSSHFGKAAMYSSLVKSAKPMSSDEIRLFILEPDKESFSLQELLLRMHDPEYEPVRE